MAGTISIHPSEVDSVAANRLWFWWVMRQRRTRIGFALGLGASALIGVAFGALLARPASAWLFPLAMAAGFVLVYGTFFGLSYAHQPRAARKLHRQTRALDRRFEMSWDEAGVTYASDAGTTRTAWSEYHGWADGRAGVLLLLNERMFHFFPRHALDDAALADLRAHAARVGRPR